MKNFLKVCIGIIFSPLVVIVFFVSLLIVSYKFILGASDEISYRMMNWIEDLFEEWK